MHAPAAGMRFAKGFGASRLLLTTSIFALAAGTGAWAQASEAGNPPPAAAPGQPPSPQAQAEQANAPGGPGAPTSSANVVSEVTVTAEFRATNVQNTPLSITAVNAAMLEQRNQTSIDQVANQAPNVTLKPDAAAFGPSLVASIRGVGQFDLDPALEPGVGLYVDDVYYPTLTGSILDLLDLDRVEIERGPQGTLSGKNSIGGSVKLYSKAPSANEGGYIEATYGGLNRIDFRGSADFAIIPDTLFMRIAGVTKHYDGYVTREDYACEFPNSGLPTVTNDRNCRLGEEGGKSYSAIRDSIRWIVSPKIEVNIIADYTDDDSEQAASTLIHAAPLSPAANALTNVSGVTYGSQFVPSDPYVSYATFMMPAGSLFGAINYNAFSAEDRSLYKGGGVSGTIDWKLFDHLTFKSITAGRTYSSTWAEDNDTSPLPLGLGQDHLSHQQISQEGRFTGDFWHVDYTFGAFYFHEKTTYATHQDLWYPGIVLDFLGNDPVIANTEAGFAHAVWHVTDKLNLTGGIRYTAEDKSYTYSRTNPDGSFNPIVGPLNGVVGLYAGTHWDYRADVDYHWTPSLMTYFQYSTGFRGGGVNPRPFVVQQVQPFGQETLDAYEIGFKDSLFDRRVRVNGSFFYNNYDAIQIAVLSCPQFGGPGPCALPENAGNATVKGVELEAEAHPIDGLELDASGSYLDFHYDSLTPAALASGVEYGMRTPYNPKYKWSLGAQYDVLLGEKFGTLTPRLDASYQGGIFTAAANSPLNYIEPYLLMNFRLTYRPPDTKWEAAFEVTNLTNKLYYLTSFDLTAAGGGSVEGEPAMPREWSITVKRKF